MRVCTSYEESTSLHLNIQEKQKYKLNVSPFYCRYDSSKRWRVSGIHHSGHLRKELMKEGRKEGWMEGRKEESTQAPEPKNSQDITIYRRSSVGCLVKPASRPKPLMQRPSEGEVFIDSPCSLTLFHCTPWQQPYTIYPDHLSNCTLLLHKGQRLPWHPGELLKVSL